MRYMALAVSFIAAMVDPTPSSALSSYKWNKRPLLVFATSEASTQFKQQQRIVAESRAGLADRDVAIVWVIGSNLSAELGQQPNVTGASLRLRFGVADNEFRAVLVGKDGSVKLSSAKPLSSNRLFETIDAMPMRRDEIRKR